MHTTRPSSNAGGHDSTPTSGPGSGTSSSSPTASPRRISHLWGGESERRAQTSGGGSFYLGEYGADFSSSRFSLVPVSSLTNTGTTRPGAAWFFHHDQWRVHNGVNTTIPFRVYRCALPAPR